MKPLVEKLALSQESSFVAQTHRTPNFEMPWHQHIEYELILFTEGAGLSFIGNYVGEFETGDVFFLGSNLPHTFQKSGHTITSAVVVHFRDDFWGTDFLQLPENKAIQNLLIKSLQGLKITGNTKEILNPLIKRLELDKNTRRIITLCECLAAIAESTDYLSVSTQEIKPLNFKDRERIDLIFKYTMEKFKEPIQLSYIAAIAGMSVPAFCNYFKKRTRKTYIDFVNEIRIGFACKLLLTTDMSVLHICFECGFNNLANFNRKFLKIKGKTPLKYRKFI